LAGRLLNPRSDGVIFGPGTAWAELAELVDRMGGRRCFVLSTPSLERAGVVDQALERLGDRAAGLWA
jgi:alcohol dehydrogenase class IV